MIRINDIYNPLVTCGGIDLGLGHLLQQLAEAFPIDLEPPYQREHRWTEQQQAAFVGHVLTGGKVDDLIVRKIEGGTADDRFEMVDGKQRLTAIVRWLRGEIPCDIDGRAVFRSDTDGNLRRITIRLAFVRLSEIECMEYYVRINRGGTPHTREEIERVEQMIAEKRAARAEV